MPLGLRKRLQHRLHLAGEGRRAAGAGQKSQPRAARSLLRRQRPLQRRHKHAERSHFPEIHHVLRAVRVVHAQERRLRKNVGPQISRRMVGISFRLDRPAHVAAHQHGNRPIGERHGGSEIQRLPGNDLFRLLDVGNDELWRLLGASAQARQRQRRTHQLQKISARNAVIPNRSLPRKLAMQHVAEAIAIRQFFQAAPVLLAFQLFQVGAHLLQVQRLRVRRRLRLFQFVVAVSAHFFTDGTSSSSSDPPASAGDTPSPAACPSHPGR